jgi:predicted metal-dependent HD superfamily phosphohydrolase
MPEIDILLNIENYIKELFRTKLKSEVLYHNIKHTVEVVAVSKEIGLSENLSESDLEILLIASWFHDTGHFHSCTGHEEQSTEYAKNYLTNISYPLNKIEVITECICATKIPQQPLNKLQEIICDADLHHLGEKDIKERGDLLRQEFELRGIKKLTEIEWITHSLAFFDQHHFFTEYAKIKYGVQKEKNVQMMKLHLEHLLESEK